MLFEPWHEFQIEAKSVSDLREVRKIPVSDICSRENKLTKEQKEILCKMLAPDYDERFDSVE